MGILSAHPGTAYPGKSARRGGHVRAILLVLLALAILIPASAGAYLVRIFDSQTTRISNAFPDESTRPQPSVPGTANGTGTAAVGSAPSSASGRSLNILVMGSDSRSATTGEATSGASSDQRADTLMLVHIPADRSKIYSISVMRDLWVGVPDHGTAKINAALAYGGVPLMVQTVESIFGQRIDHVVLIDFQGFVGMTDALGGVEVNIPAPLVPYHNQISFPAGPMTLDGKSALEFVRERYAFADGDYQRVRNQQAFAKALLAKNLSADTLLNPLKVNNVVSAMAPFISVDSGLDAATLAGLAVELKNVRPSDMVMFTLPTRGTGTSADGQSIVLTDPASISAISAAMAADTLGDYVAANGLQHGN
ncbi:LytR family transcriptional regulator [Pseudarthrobacter psychrotolerans]|uniref:LytR family transcriptional regulator n=1 Tax=Pseudarthrobacter psychrotolerans TaxID=2697569 RepID=A0A6P1NLR2_9MICC|nr:LCP family protein [Pseudarthrobacter psychrotolerans]QHK20238.1 LytR family transcriptional regulator [Pseudarthrobacter psychrotolerans]